MVHFQFCPPLKWVDHVLESDKYSCATWTSAAEGGHEGTHIEDSPSTLRNWEKVIHWRGIWVANSRVSSFYNLVQSLLPSRKLYIHIFLPDTVFPSFAWVIYLHPPEIGYHFSTIEFFLMSSTARFMLLYKFLDLPPSLEAERYIQRGNL